MNQLFITTLTIILSLSSWAEVVNIDLIKAYRAAPAVARKNARHIFRNLNTPHELLVPNMVGRACAKLLKTVKPSPYIEWAPKQADELTSAVIMQILNSGEDVEKAMISVALTEIAKPTFANPSVVNGIDQFHFLSFPSEVYNELFNDSSRKTVERILSIANSLALQKSRGYNFYIIINELSYAKGFFHIVMSIIDPTGAVRHLAVRARTKDGWEFDVGRKIVDEVLPTSGTSFNNYILDRPLEFVIPALTL